MYVARLSFRAWLLGWGAVALVGGGAAGGWLMLFTDYELRLTRHYGFPYQLFVGVGGTGMCLALIISQLRAFRHRAQLVLVDGGQLEIVTFLRRRRVALADVDSVAYDEKHRSLVVTVGGKKLRPVFRPDQTSWRVVAQELAALVKDAAGAL